MNTWIGYINKVCCQFWLLIWTEFIVHREGGEGLDGWYCYFNQPGVSFNFIRVHENLEQHPSNYKSIIQVKRTLNLKSSKAFFPVFQSSGSLAMVKLASIPGTLSMNMKNLRSVLLVIVTIFLCYEYLLYPHCLFVHFMIFLCFEVRYLKILPSLFLNYLSGNVKWIKWAKNLKT